jgi:ubiquitin thioesterase protein OTUB1
MKTHAENYIGFMLGQTVDQYVNSMIMPHGAEIDDLGVNALKDVLLSPASIALEIVYLDRSEGSEVNTHRYDPLNGYTTATVRLLYRP